jgi:hypothetical protein
MRAVPIAVCLAAMFWPGGELVSTQTGAYTAEQAWDRIRKSAPYEWEGDIDAIAEWTLGNYGKFIDDYPSHPLAAEAMLNVARATWASGGYPELFYYIIAPTWAEHEAKTRHLSQWFDTSGFGGGLGTAAKQDPQAAARARESFVALAAKFPSSAAAVTARYYSAVILDYCLNDTVKAIAEYEAFVKRHPTSADAVRARRRITALRR